MSDYKAFAKDGIHKMSYIIGEKVEFDGFTFSKNTITSNPILLMMLVLCIDPTNKQKELMKKLEITFADDKGNIVFPPPDDVELPKKESGS